MVGKKIHHGDAAKNVHDGLVPLRVEGIDETSDEELNHGYLFTVTPNLTIFSSIGCMMAWTFYL
jgi:hypothetical protein